MSRRYHRPQGHTIVFLLTAWLVGVPLLGQTTTIQSTKVLSCERGDTAEGACCCYKPTHTYRFEPVTIARLAVIFDTGGGLDCKSQVGIQALTTRGWQTIQTVNAVSSSGRSETHRQRRLFEIGQPLGGIRIDDRGRCHIDHSEIRFETTKEPPRLIHPRESADLTSGSYRVQVISDRSVESTWHLERSGAKITGKSEWECCPPQRVDPLSGSIDGRRVSITRDCSDRRYGNFCAEIYEGTITGGSVQGSFQRNGRFAGRWTLDLGSREQDPPRPGPGDKPTLGSIEIEAETPAPYLVGSTVILRQRPRPVKGARWFLRGQPLSDNETLRWRPQEVGNYHISLRSRDDQVLDNIRIEVDQKGVYRLAGKQMRGKEEPHSGSHRGVRNENRELVLYRSASVLKVEGSARKYCIWTLTPDHEIGERVACGGEKNPLVGAILLPGNYVVLPALTQQQRYCDVTVYLRER